MEKIQDDYTKLIKRLREQQARIEQLEKENQRLEDITKLQLGIITGMEETIQTYEHDALTGCSSNAVFHKQYKNINAKIRTIIEQIQNGDNEVNCAVILADIDNLKYINESRSYEEADKGIIAMSRVIVAAFSSPENRMYRKGGDELVFVIFDKTKKEVEEDIRKVNEELIRNKESKNYGLTMSFGIADTRDIAKLDGILETADIYELLRDIAAREMKRQKDDTRLDKQGEEEFLVRTGHYIKRVLKERFAEEKKKAYLEYVEAGMDGKTLKGIEETAEIKESVADESKDNGQFNNRRKSFIQRINTDALPTSNPRPSHKKVDEDRGLEEK